MSSAPRPESVPDPQRDDSEEEGATPPRKQVYLRTVYALNPGIPHYVDVPGGWQ